MSEGKKSYEGERYTTQGQLRISIRQLMALNALLDTPNGEVGSIREWHALVRRYGEYLHRDNVWEMPPSWVKLHRVGSRVSAGITPRGRAILQRVVPLYIHGCGPIAGVRELFSRRNTKNR